MTSSHRILFPLGLALSLVLAACATATPTAAPTGAPDVDPMAMYEPAAVSGNVISAGSSTVFPLTEAVAELFYDEGFAGEITIDSVGTGAGFERFCVAGETDISNASRPIRDEEISSCQSIGREPLEFRVGTDALAIAVSRENTFLTDVTLDQLGLIFSIAEAWNEVDPSWPAEPILRFSPGTDSGTFDYFVEEIFDSEESPLLNASNLQLSEDDNILVQGVEGSPFAIGYFGYAYYEANADRLTVLSVDGVTPSGETVDSATYPLARPLFIYSTATILQEKPQVAAFVSFYLTRVNEVIGEVGYFPAAQEVLDAGLQAWNDAVGM